MKHKFQNLFGVGCLAAMEFLFLILFWIYARYDERILPNDLQNSEQKPNLAMYSQFQGVHVMIFLGFGLLMAFLRKFGYSAVGYSFLLAAFIVQWAVLLKGFFKFFNGSLTISLDSIVDADIIAAVSLISMGAVIGRTSPFELCVMGFIETAIFVANEHFQLNFLKITDVGGSITVHAFGAYFGLAVSFAMRAKKSDSVSTTCGSASYLSDIMALVGTILLWMFWPSFNSVLACESDQERAILNTYMSLASCTVTTFIISAIVAPDRKFDMVHIQNSTLAGGVAIGSVCNLIIGPQIALLIGVLAGVLSVLGYKYVTPFLASKLRILDTCGVHNLHGMPAILSAVFSAVYASKAKVENYQNSLDCIFPAMMNSSTVATNSTSFAVMSFGRTAATQAGFQMLGVASTIAIAIAAGVVTGLALKLLNLGKVPREKHYEDELHWEMPDAHTA